MLTSQFSLQDALEKIRDLMAQEQWAEAHRACIEVLRFDPKLSPILRFKKKIEKKVKKINTQALKEDIKELKKLWKDGQYNEFHQKLQGLKPFARDYNHLQYLIEKAEKRLLKKEVQEQKNKYIELANIAQELMNNHRYEDALLAVKNKPINEYNPKDIATLTQTIKNQWITYSIAKSEKNFSADQYQEKLKFLESLKEIDANSSILQHHIKQVAQQHKLSSLDQHRDKIFKSLENIQTLIQLQKYTEAIQALEEILAIDPENIRAKKLLKKAEKKANQIRDMQLLEQIDNAHQHQDTSEQTIKI